MGEHVGEQIVGYCRRTIGIFVGFYARLPQKEMEYFLFKIVTYNGYQYKILDCEVLYN